MFENRDTRTAHRRAHSQPQQHFNSTGTSWRSDDSTTLLGWSHALSTPVLPKGMRLWVAHSTGVHTKMISISLVLNRRITAFVSHPFDSVQERSSPGQAFAPEAEHTVDLLHQSSAFYSPWYIVVSVDLHISVCTLHPLIQAVLLSLDLIEGVSQNLALFLERQFAKPCARPDRHVFPFFVSIGACPPQTCWFRCHFSASSNKSNICLRCV